MKQSLLEDILKALDQRLVPPFDLDALSKEIGYSKYHLCRAFHAATGEGLVTYLRRLSLSRSALCLKEGERVLDVALANGYQSQEAYHRAFVKMFNMTPSEFQHGKHHHSMFLKQPWNKQLMPISEPENYSLALDDFCLWGMGGEYSYDHFDDMFDLWRKFHCHVPHSQETFGTTFPLTQRTHHFRYFAASGTPCESISLVRLHIPKQRYQVFIHQGKAENLLQTLNYIWGIWMPNHGFSVSGIDFERYPPDYHPEDPNGRVELHIPIVDIKNQHHQGNSKS